MKTLKLVLIVSFASCFIFASCIPTTPITPGGGTGTDTTGTGTGTSTIPAVYQKIYGATDMYIDGSYLVIKSNGLPDHKSPYYQGTTWAATKYEAYNGTGSFSINPNRIAEQSLTFRIPLNPVQASTHSSTPMGPMGIAVNGIPLFNQYAAGGSPLTSEIISFDQYAGHPQQQGQYHYHIEPTYITTNKGKDALIGFLLDGFPVYGPMENGATVSASSLDVYHGHVGVTADYPNGIYHYHTTATAPYINGNGFYGTAGTVTY